MTNAAEPPVTIWRKSSRSGGGQECVEIAEITTGTRDRRPYPDQVEAGRTAVACTPR